MITADPATVGQRALTLAGAPREEQALARRLFSALGQDLLAGLD